MILALALIFSFVLLLSLYVSIFFFFNDTATTEIYTLSLHDALPISNSRLNDRIRDAFVWASTERIEWLSPVKSDEYAEYYDRSEEHTSELQSLRHLVCRLLLEKKKKVTMRFAFI